MNIEKIEKLTKYSKKFKLLYVEDDGVARESMLEVLELFFDNINVAVNGEDGLEKFLYFENNKNLSSIDLIITDINMPKMDGLEMIHKIRELNNDVSIVVLSAHNESDYFINSIRLGINNFLLKPINVDDFLIVIEKVFEKIILLNKAKENLQLLNEYQEAINHASIVSKTDIKGVITYANDEFCKVSKYKRDELLGQPHNIVRHPDVPASVFKDMWDTIQNKKQVWKGRVKNRSKDGKEYYVDSTVKPILNSDGEIIEYIAIRNEITELVNLNEEVSKLHAYDVEQQSIASEKIEIGIRNDMNEDEAKVVYLPLDILSGDFYSLYKCKKDFTFMYIIDGQGHGISPALTVFSASSIINHNIIEVTNLNELIENIFPLIKTFLGDEEQLSYVMIMIDKNTNTLSYTSGGMHPFLIKTRDEIIKVKANNIPFMNFSHNPIVNTITLENFESLLIYSDGFVEHRDESLAMYTPTSIINKPSLIDDAIDAMKNTTLEDDVTLIHFNNLMN